MIAIGTADFNATELNRYCREWVMFNKKVVNSGSI